MGKNNNVQQEQKRNSIEAAEVQNKAMREFVEENTVDSRTKGLVDESTARLSDDQNRLITQHNLRK
ncbi:hypothetical protein JI735_29885 [Paenibacillus sonchi]|uniref:Uncharacterized protein n=3 Tax=Paenibacillus sonchi group TaxID=2044880 RepID=A0A974SDS2_9BACL|nr:MULTISPECIES: hypothetical protein [Paenibacillus sonchi group]KWX74731.1 hypothetical protein AMQ84_20220 [Paenibacillus riograndensis]KWX85453.1 hypothetical protein AMQ83_24600 [Paenibacillus riograndensis]MCE3201876.1 hypothetical protein [Paenibacillus sonchi]QQZ60640.1 hypothetical protein JI735_29885 [Paenibacillus sonchi]CQR56823.1 hypothetical protein PRIO_4421 [Paenibacillus riograndensis SBR5]